ncbi:MAG: hypothetical protein IPM17_10995 [Verrucomicrobia bacterium]|jgi:hypothetical protein|nr:hypothetical protein [Verrucomicrobiota bacterium]
MKSHALFCLLGGGAVLSTAQFAIVSFDFTGPTTAPASVALNATATSFSFDNFSPSLPGPGNGPTTYAVALNGTLVAGPLPTSVNTWGAVTVPLVFNGPSSLVQILAWGGTGIPLVPAIVQGWAVDNVVLEGAVIPEPAVAAGVAASAFSALSSGGGGKADGATCLAELPGAAGRLRLFASLLRPLH